MIANHPTPYCIRLTHGMTNYGNIILIMLVFIPFVKIVCFVWNNAIRLLFVCACVAYCYRDTCQQMLIAWLKSAFKLGGGGLLRVLAQLAQCAHVSLNVPTWIKSLFTSINNTKAIRRFITSTSYQTCFLGDNTSHVDPQKMQNKKDKQYAKIICKLERNLTGPHKQKATVWFDVYDSKPLRN